MCGGFSLSQQPIVRIKRPLGWTLEGWCGTFWVFLVEILGFLGGDFGFFGERFWVFFGGGV